MRNLFMRLWNDDAGFILSAEYLFLFTILVLGCLVGWVHVRNAIVIEMTEAASSILALDNSYSYQGLDSAGPLTATTAGSQFIDPAADPPLNVISVAPTISTSAFLSNYIP